jgi:hypothetical protein
MGVRKESLFIHPPAPAKSNYLSAKNIFVLLTTLFIIFRPVFASNPFVMVMYDSKTEEHLGPFPPVSREIYGIIISKLKEFGAKAVVIKFFLDQNKDPAGDSVFAASLKIIPTFLQARILNSDQCLNQMDSSRFSISLSKIPPHLSSGKPGCVPLKEFCKNAYDIGFVDIRKTENIPLFVKYQNTIYKSLWFALLQYALPNLCTNGKYLSNGKKKVVINKYGEVPVNYPQKDSLKYISFYDVFRDKIDKSLIANKIVLIGYDGKLIDSLMTPIGKVKVHRIFYYSIVDIYNQLQ